MIFVVGVVFIYGIKCCELGWWWWEVLFVVYLMINFLFGVYFIRFEYFVYGLMILNFVIDYRRDVWYY